MWSYYAANHSGLVLRFTSGATNNAFSSARPVRYIDQMPSLFDEKALCDLLALEGHHNSDADRIFDEVIWTKSSHWAHEREWRIYGGVGETVAAYEDVPFTATELDGVIFGLRIAEDDKATIADLIQAKYPHTESLQAKAKPNAYELVIKSFDGDREA